MKMNLPAATQIPIGRKKRILFLTDKIGVSQGYNSLFKYLLDRVGLSINQVSITSIYTLVSNVLYKKGNEKTWKFNPEKKDEIQKAMEYKIKATNPDIIVVCDPAVLGYFCNWDSRVATLDKCRGGRYDYYGIPVFVTYPITAAHQIVDEITTLDVDGEDVPYEPYKVKSGNWIIQRDWEKVSRCAHEREVKLFDFQYTVCKTIQEVKMAAQFLDSCSAIAVDIETGCFPPQITCIGFYGLNSAGDHMGFVVPLQDPTSQSKMFWDQTDFQIVWGLLKHILNNDVSKIMQNGYYDASYFVRFGLGIRNFNFDLMLLWYSSYPEMKKSLDFISSVLLDNYQYWKDDIKGVEVEGADQAQKNIQMYWRYNALDCYYTLTAAMRLINLLKGNKTLRRNFEDSMSRMYSGLYMSMRGTKIDFREKERLIGGLMKESQEAVATFRFIIADNEFNVQSPLQKSELFYKVLGATPRTDKGRVIGKDSKASPSTGKIALKGVRTEHPFFAYIVDHLDKAMVPLKQISNLNGLTPNKRRLLTSFGAAGTPTTRFNSKKSNFWNGGNVQNIRDSYRSWMTADEGCLLFDADFSQSDDVFVGYESEDPDKIKVIESGIDGHSFHAEMFFKKAYDEVVAGKKAGEDWVSHPIYGVRNLSKRVVHGSNFLMAAMTLYFTMGRDAVVGAAKALGIPGADQLNQEQLVAICGQLMQVYRKKYKRLNHRGWYGELQETLERTATLVNAFNFSRKFMSDPKDHGTLREACGFIGQSDTAGNMNRVQDEINFGKISQYFRDGLNPSFGQSALQMNLDSHGFELLMQIHDSFVGQVHLSHPKWQEGLNNLLHVMQRPIMIHGRTFFVKAEMKIGLRWGKSMVEYKPNGKVSLEDQVNQLLMKGITYAT